MFWLTTYIVIYKPQSKEGNANKRTFIKLSDIGFLIQFCFSLRKKRLMVTWAPFEISVNIVCLIGLKNTLCDPKRLSHYLFPLYLSTTTPFFL